MRKLLSFVLGIAIGAALGAAFMTLYAPVSGDQLKRNLKEGWDGAMQEARHASESRRAELEAELARRRGMGPKPLP